MEWRYTIYSEVGNMRDLLDMSYWDFWGVVDSMLLRAKRRSGETVTRKELKPSQKQMIENRKKLVAREASLGDNKNGNNN